MALYPAAHADAMAVPFGTSLHYGHANARVKVMQALAILQNDIATGTTTAPRADLEKDVIAHMLVPMYQGAIQAAHKMDALEACLSSPAKAIQSV